MAEQKQAWLGWQPVDPPQRPVLIVNPRSGEGTAARVGLAERARDLGIEVVILAPGENLVRLISAAVESGADALGMAGGDGSLAVVAAAAAAHDRSFICVPAGTRNHFALDLGVDRHDVLGALDAFTDAVERRIDVAEVDGRPFPQQRVARDLRRGGSPGGLSRRQGTHPRRDRGEGPRSTRTGTCTAPRRRCRTRA